jgi:tetratricopeptide (TPR) repeat protein
MYELAKECFFEALEIRHECLGQSHHDVAILWYNIATVYFETGEGDMAVAYYRESLKVERASLGEEHPDVVLTLQHLGQVHQQLGLLDDAATYFKEALDMESKCKRNNFRFEAKLWNQLGNVYLAVGHVEKMMETYIQASRIYKKYDESADNLLIIGYNYYGLTRLHPPCAPLA